MLVPPAGRYQAPFYFSVYMSGGNANVDSSDHRRMLFSPNSSSPSGFYEAGGPHNRIAETDVILKDCRLVMTVVDLKEGVTLAAAQEVPLGKRLELGKGQFRVTAELLSFGLNSFAKCEGIFDIVDGLEHRQLAVANGVAAVPLVSGSVFDQLDSVLRGGGVPVSPSMESTHAKPMGGGSNATRRDSALGRQTAGGALRHHSQLEDDATSATPQPMSSSSAVEASVRLSNEVLMQAINNPAAALLQQQAADVARISRTSSFASQHAGSPSIAAQSGSPFLRPPLGGGAARTTSGGQHAEHNAMDTVPPDQADDAAMDASPAAGGGIAAPTLRGGFAIPPPTAVRLGSGSRLTFALALRGGQTTQRAASLASSGSGAMSFATTPVHVMLQEEQEIRDPDADPALLSAPLLLDGRSHLVACPMEAKGAYLHWQSLGGSSADTSVARLVQRGQMGLALQGPPLPLRRAAGSTSAPMVVSAAGVSTESVSISPEDGVFGGIQFSLGSPTISSGASVLPQNCSRMSVLISFRVMEPPRRRSASDVVPPLQLPYLETEVLRSGDCRLIWRYQGSADDDGDDTHDEASHEDVVLYDGTGTTDDTISMCFVPPPGDSKGVATRHGAAEAASPVASSSFLLLMVNYRTVASFPIPSVSQQQQVMMFGAGSSSAPRTSRWEPSSPHNMLRVALVARATFQQQQQQPESSGASSASTSTFVSLLHSVTCLTHRTKLVDLISLPVGDVERSAARSGVALDGAKTLYCWRRGEALNHAASTKMVFLATDAVAPPLQHQPHASSFF